MSVCVSLAADERFGIPQVKIGGEQDLVLICGPCVIESRDHLLFMAESIAGICNQLAIPLIFKSSYDKANRTSLSSYRGVGILEGLRYLQDVREKIGVHVITDVHSCEDVKEASQAVDILQIPAFLCRQTDLLLAAGASMKTINVKKGQFLHPSDMRYCIDKISSTSNNSILLCERGSCFGYRELVVDFRSLAIMREFGYPCVFDVTHSVQVMGGGQGSSFGDRKSVPLLARAGVAIGIDALFMECHNEPEKALSDGPNVVPLDKLKNLLRELKQLSSCVQELKQKGLRVSW